MLIKDLSLRADDMKNSKRRQININLIVLGVIFAITFVSLFTYIPLYLNTLEQKTQDIKQDAELQSILLKQIFKPVINAKTLYSKNRNTQLALQEIKSLWFELNRDRPQQEFFLVHKNPTTDKIELVLSSKAGTTFPGTVRLVKPTMYMAIGGHYGVQSITDISNSTVLTAYAPVIPKEWGVIIKYEQQTINPSLIETLSYTLFAALLITLIIWLVLRLTLRHINNRVTSSEERYEQLLENSPDWIWEIDKLGIIKYSSKQVYSILGYQPEEVLLKPLSAFFDPQDAKTSTLNWQQKIMLKEPFSDLELGLLNKSKEHVYMLVSGQPIFNKSHNLIGYRGIAKNISTLKQHDKNILNLAFYDPLTKLANRLNFIETLKKHIKSQSATALKPSALLFIDLNGFKPVNDIEGHESGDKLLTIIAQRMQNHARMTDLVARFGGDEFVILIKQEHTTRPTEFQRNLEHYLDRLLEKIAEPIHINNKQLKIGASIGVAIIPKDGNNVSAILNHADVAMYQAKSKGKSNYHFYDQFTQTNMDKLLKSSAELKQAISKDQFQLYYQFQYDSDSDKIIGMEAFLRWHHPETHKILPANEFLTLAYNTNNINAIDEWVIKTAAKDIHKLNQKGIKAPPISINLSTQKLEESTLPRAFEEAIKRNFISASALKIEITENTLLHDLEKSRHTIEQLRQQGIKVCIDNFGTGYSSLSYIQALPIESIKIDKSFIENIATSHSDLQMCRTFIQLGESLKIDVIAEGIQSEVQSEILKKEGCHKLQGYLYSNPKPIDKIIIELSKNPLSI